MAITRRDLHRFALGTPIFSAVGTQAFSAIVDHPRSEPDPLRLVDSELRDVARTMIPQAGAHITAESIAILRSSWPVPPLLPSPAAHVQVIEIAGAPGNPSVGIEVIGVRHGEKPRPAILHIHGGGMICGRARHMTAFCQSLSDEFDCVVINVDYRLSPETTFPGPVLDNYAALAWLNANAGTLGVDRSRIAIMGESAGGGLAALVGLMARDKGGISPCQLMLLYPMLDDRTGSLHKVPPHIAPVGWSPEANRFGWTAFLGVPAGSAKVPPNGAPARFADLSGLPSTFIGVGAIDLFAIEDLAFGTRLVEAGVPTKIEIVPGAFHGFDVAVPTARVSKEFTATWKSALSAAFAA